MRHLAFCLFLDAYSLLKFWPKAKTASFSVDAVIPLEVKKEFSLDVDE